MKLLVFLLIVTQSVGAALAAEPACPPPRQALESALHEMRALAHTPRSAHVTQRVPGLYESIPATESFTAGGYSFKTRVTTYEGGDFLMETTIRNSAGREVGAFSSSYDPGTRTLTVVSGNLWPGAAEPGPAFVRREGHPELVAGRGIPTQMLARLHHLRLAGVEMARGDAIRTMRTSPITNHRVSAELAQVPQIRAWLRANTSQAGLRPGARLSELQALVDQHIMETQTGRYMSDVLTQSGFCVAPGGMKTRNFGILPNEFLSVSQNADPVTFSAFERMEAEGIHQVPADFEIVAEVAACVLPSAQTPRSAHVTQRVPGLYESVPTTESFVSGGYRFATEVNRAPNGSALMETTIYNSQGREVGNFHTRYYAPDRKLELIGASMQLDPGHPAPSFVHAPGAAELVPGRGIPTQMMIRLQHMRLAGIEPGSSALLRVETEGLSNQRVLAELLETPEIRAGLRSGVDEARLRTLVEQHIGQTQAGRYIRDMITQSGFCLGAGGFRIEGQFAVQRPDLRGISRTSSPEAYAAMERIIAEGIQRVPAMGFAVSVDVTQCVR